MTPTCYLAETATSSRRCQRWNNRHMAWQTADPTERFNAARYEVGDVDHATARAYVTRHHYAGTYVVDKHRFGLYRAGQLVGVAVYSIPTSTRLLTNLLPDLQPFVESIELGRLVLADAEPGNAETWFLARCHQQLHGRGTRAIVACADPVPRRMPDGTTVAPGHVGYIYQGSNAVYTGRTTPRTHLLLRDGTILSPRTLQKIRGQEAGHESAERGLVRLGARRMWAGERPAVWLAEILPTVVAQRLRHGGCHRYVLPLGSARQRRAVRITAVPGAYPKFTDSLSGDAA
jgi:hypothetical protein